MYCTMVEHFLNQLPNGHNGFFFLTFQDFLPVAQKIKPDTAALITFNGHFKSDISDCIIAGNGHNVRFHGTGFYPTGHHLKSSWLWL